jgi:Kef-type K+ transport system membrane component KefB
VLYLGIIGTAAGTLLVVLGLARGIDPPPQLPQLLDTNQASASCLGTTVATLQSGVFLDLHVANLATLKDGEEDLGDRVGKGRIDPITGRIAVSGTCPPSSELGARPFDAYITVQSAAEERVGAASAVGQLQVDGQPSVDLELRKAESTSRQGGATALKHLSGSETLARVLFAVAAIWIAALLLGRLFNRIGQPHVLGEIVAGIVLGPSVLGMLRPEVTDYLFPSEVVSVLRSMAYVGLIFFMFLVGLRLDLTLVRRRGHGALLISHASIALPFILGVMVALVVYPLVGSSTFVGFALFMGAAMAITAFPVLARILTDTGLYHTSIGMLSIACAAVDDVTAWCLLAVVTAVVKSSGFSHVVGTIVLSAAFAAVMILVVRRLVARVATYYESRVRLVIVGGVVASVFLAAWITEAIGSHAIFGAFLLGVVMPRSHQMVADLADKFENVTTYLLLPIFFAIVGLETRIGLTVQPALWWSLALLILAAAIIGKWGSSTLAARMAGFNWKESNVLGILLNTRGLTEIVILTVGRDLGVVSPALFTMMVFMALVTTMMATPLLHALGASRLRAV